MTIFSRSFIFIIFFGILIADPFLVSIYSQTLADDASQNGDLSSMADESVPSSSDADEVIPYIVEDDDFDDAAAVDEVKTESTRSLPFKQSNSSDNILNLIQANWQIVVGLVVVVLFFSLLLWMLFRRRNQVVRYRAPSVAPARAPEASSLPQNASFPFNNGDGAFGVESAMPYDDRLPLFSGDDERSMFFADEIDLDEAKLDDNVLHDEELMKEIETAMSGVVESKLDPVEPRESEMSREEDIAAFEAANLSDPFPSDGGEGDSQPITGIIEIRIAAIQAALSEEQQRSHLLREEQQKLKDLINRLKLKLKNAKRVVARSDSESIGQRNREEYGIDADLVVKLQEENKTLATQLQVERVKRRAQDMELRRNSSTIEAIAARLKLVNAERDNLARMLYDAKRRALQPTVEVPGKPR